MKAISKCQSKPSSSAFQKSRGALSGRSFRESCRSATIFRPSGPMCEQMGVSRSVVPRGAGGGSRAWGWSRAGRARGTRVASPSGARDLGRVRTADALLRRRPLEDLAVVRLPLETTIAALAASNRTEPQLARLEATQSILGNPRKSLGGARESRWRISFDPCRGDRQSVSSPWSWHRSTTCSSKAG